jgi:cytosolic carboxypeptidase protein 2/3
VLKKLLNGNAVVKWCWDEGELVPDHTLVFESRFESGNLDMAIKVSEKTYLLLMQNDTNTKGNNQWFYFKVSNAAKGSAISFQIANYVII